MFVPGTSLVNTTFVAKDSVSLIVCYHAEQNDLSVAFKRLKRMFITAPILAQFSPECDMVIEADSSEWATGGVLSQYVDGVLHPCVYFSRKNLSVECNYKIHDKELLAIINCLKEWESELMSVICFTIITDHKNLCYFMQL